MTDLPELPELPTMPAFFGVAYLELTHRGGPIFVRLDSIISVRPEGDVTLVELSTRAVYSVSESAEVVFERMTEVLGGG